MTHDCKYCSPGDFTMRFDQPDGKYVCVGGCGRGYIVRTKDGVKTFYPLARITKEILEASRGDPSDFIKVGES